MLLKTALKWTKSFIRLTFECTDTTYVSVYNDINDEAPTSFILFTHGFGTNLLIAIFTNNIASFIFTFWRISKCCSINIILCCMHVAQFRRVFAHFYNLILLQRTATLFSSLSFIFLLLFYLVQQQLTYMSINVYGIW